jgi:hypothetical protein
LSNDPVTQAPKKRRVQWYSTYAIMGENLPILDFFVATPPENAAEQQEIVILPCTTTLLLILRIYSSFLPSFLLL